jgi:UDP-N-acetylglucosamine 2-epimerase (non-hydrolysing)
MKIITVVGARPNFMKAAPIIAAIRKYNQAVAKAGAELTHQASVPSIDHILVHTGQHYDALMSDSFFADLNLPPPDIRLGVGSGSHAVQTAEILKGFEAVLLRERPDVVIVVGDVNSTVACALVTAKISFDLAGTRPLLAHVEAGLRSFDRAMPEEVNRVLTDHISDLLFVTEESGIQNLRNEGISPGTIHFVGNTMIDSLLVFKERAESSSILDRLGLRAPAGGNGEGKPIKHYALLTLHRPSNVDNRDTFLDILSGLKELAEDCPIVFPAHPRTQQRITEFGLELRLEINETKMKKEDARDSRSRQGGIILTEPLGYLDFLCMMKHAALVVTDSGGIQEETTCLGIPCVTVRENTERPVTVERGTNIIAGTTKERIAAAIQRQMGRKDGSSKPEKWDGQAATRILDVLIRVNNERTVSRQSVISQSGA